MRTPAKGQGNKIDPAKTDITSTLSDALLLRILSSLPESARAPCGLVCHRWLRITGTLRRSLSLLDWDFLESGRLTYRFPQLTEVDLTWASTRDVPGMRPVVLALPKLVLPIFPIVAREDYPFSLEGCIRSQQVTTEELNRGLSVLASGCPDLKRLRFVDVSNSKRFGGAFSEWEFVSASETIGKETAENVKDEEKRGGSRELLLSFTAEEDKALVDNVGRKVSLKDGTDDERKSLEDEADSGEKNVVLNADMEEQNGIPNGHSQVHSMTSDAEVGIDGAPNADRGFDYVKSNVVAGARIGRPNDDMGTKDVTVNSDNRLENTASPKVGGDEKAPTDFTTRTESRGPGKGSRQEEPGLVSVGRKCPQLQELEVHQCSDETITALVACQHVQVLRLVGTIHGFSTCSFTDVGLTILANKCRRLVKLDLSGCEASFAGIAAIGQCCSTLEDLVITSTGFHGGWLGALGFFVGLKSLRLESCKSIDPDPGPLEFIGQFHTLETLQLVCCDLRDQVGLAALLTLSINLRNLEFQDCWGLDDDTFHLASRCRKLRLLSLDGCSLVTTAGLESVALACKELQRLRVVHCNNIREAEISPGFGDVVVMLKEFQWRPDTKSLLMGSPEIAQAGRWFFKA